MKKFGLLFCLLFASSILISNLASAFDVNSIFTKTKEMTVIRNGKVYLKEDLPLPKDHDKLMAGKPKYIIFNNFNTEFINTAYFNYLSDKEINPDYFDKIISAPFSDATLDQYKLTDFDLAIFPMGDLSISLQTSSGKYNLINEMKGMIKAGKKVLLIGNSIAYQAFNDNSPYQDTIAQNFLKEYFGVDYIFNPTLVARQDGSTVTWWTFYIRGHLADPVGMSVYKLVNGSFNTGQETWDPLRYPVLFLDIFKSKDKDAYPEVEHYTPDHGVPVTDTIVGSRHEIGLSRMVFINIGFESFAGDIPRYTQMQRCMMWLLGNIPPDGPMARYEPPSLSYGNVLIGSSFENTLNIVSSGKQYLQIGETRWDNNDDNVFQITSGEVKVSSPVSVKTGDIHTVSIKFTPKEEKAYTGWLTIVTNVKDDEEKLITLEGFGGEGSGAKIQTNFADNLISFGDVTPSKIKIDTNLIIKNTGDIELNISKLELTDNASGLFNIPQVMTMPVLIPAGKAVPIKLRFICGQNDGNFTAKLHLESNAKNTPSLDINLAGSVSGNTSVNDNTASTPDGLFELSVNPNPVSNIAAIAYRLNGDAPRNAELNLIDINGRKLMSLLRQTISPGEGSVELHTLLLAPGTYFISGDINGNKVQIPVIIIK